MMEFVIICIVLEIFGLIERCVEGGLSCPTGRSQRKLGRNDFCDMCISRKSLTTNLSKKNVRSGQLKAAGHFA